MRAKLLKKRAAQSHESAKNKSAAPKGRGGPNLFML